MNYGEVINILKYLKLYHPNSQVTNTALNMAIKACKQQIPIKPDRFTGKCRCGVFLGNWDANYCSKCGRRLDFGKEKKR